MQVWCEMELLFLRAHASGYRGCAIDEQSYFFFQCNRKNRLKRLFCYPKEDFADQDHFIAMMQKFISPPAFLRPSVTVSALTIEELDRVYQKIKS
jgi:hypothetical protein